MLLVDGETAAAVRGGFTQPPSCVSLRGPAVGETHPGALPPDSASDEKGEAATGSVNGDGEGPSPLSGCGRTAEEKIACLSG